jgi:hypothetical protein
LHDGHEVCLPWFADISTQRIPSHQETTAGEPLKKSLLLSCK